MGLTAGTAIVTAAEVAEITQEPALASLDQGSDATLANALGHGTTAVMIALELRGVTPERVDTANAKTLAYLKHAVAHWIKWQKMAGAPMGADQGDVNQRKAKEAENRFRELVTTLVISVTNASGTAEKTASAKGLPCIGNFEPESGIGAATDNRMPGRTRISGWTG